MSHDISRFGQPRRGAKIAVFRDIVLFGHEGCSISRRERTGVILETMFDPTELGTEALRPIRRTEYDRMVEQGCFDEHERLELLRGWLIRMSPPKPPHADVVAVLDRLLMPLLAERAHIRVQSPLALGEDSEPEPDLALVPPRRYSDEHPSEAFLVIEVSDSSLRRDRRVKADLYAEHGIPEYWIVNLQERCFEVHRSPSPSGYQRVERFSEGAKIQLAAFPEISVEVSAVLPRR